MEAKVEIISRFVPLSLTEKISILEILSKLVHQEIEDDSIPEICSTKDFNDILDSDKENKTELPELHPLTGSIHWQEADKLESCSDCGGKSLIKWGSYKGQQRYKCKTCCHTFTANTSTLSYGIKKIKEFESFGHSMFEGNYESLSQLSQQLKIDRNTAFNWRHKYLSAITLVVSEDQFTGTVEMDDVWFGLDEKGRQIREEGKVREPIGAGDNDMQVKLLCCYERESNQFDAFVVRSGRLKKEDIERSVGDKFAQGSKIYSDKHQSIKAFTAKQNIEHHTFYAKKHVKDGDIHVQNINGYASEMKNILLRKMKGVATKYLQNYANWFITNKKILKTDTNSVDIINKYKSNSKNWDYYSNAEKIYKRFLEMFSKLEYINPVKMKLKSCLWNFERISQSLYS